MCVIDVVCEVSTRDASPDAVDVADAGVDGARPAIDADRIGCRGRPVIRAGRRDERRDLSVLYFILRDSFSDVSTNAVDVAAVGGA